MTTVFTVITVALILVGRSDRRVTRAAGLRRGRALVIRAPNTLKPA
ncbi:MAG: hypothetical protein H0V17_34745 [Deltaproteobacteria bacterium]|nr:hypothetical protein [Deltaproteobacteria bacterium]